MVDIDRYRVIERALLDPESALDIVDVGKVIRFFGFGSIHTSETFTFFNLEEDVSFVVSVAGWRQHPRPALTHLRQGITDWLRERRAQGLQPLEIDLTSFDRLLEFDRILRRRLRPYME